MNLVDIIRIRAKLLGLAVLLAAFAVGGYVSVLPASADDRAGMSLSASGGNAFCDGTTCWVEPGQTFTLAVNADVAPAGGYIGVTSVVQYGPDLAYTPTDSALDEIVWPDCDEAIAVRAEFPEDSIHHGCLSGLAPPLPVSTYTGPVFEIELTCTDEVTTNDVRLLPHGHELADTSGAAFATDISVVVIPKIQPLTLVCDDPPPTPTPTPIPDDPEEPVDDLPRTGSGGPSAGQGSSTSVVLWLVLSTLLAVGVAGAGLFLKGTVAGRSR